MKKIAHLVLALIALFSFENAHAKKKPKPSKPPINNWLTPQFGPAPVPITVKVIQLAGAGCPSETASVTLAPDGRSFSILFDELKVQVDSVSTNAHKTCAVLLGIQLSGQYRAAIVGSDVRGFIGLPASSVGSIAVQHYSVFNPDPRITARMNFTKNFTGPVQQDVEMFSRFTDMPLWSNCGSHTQYNSHIPFMQINIDLDVKNSNPSETAIAAVDSLDFSGHSELTYQLAWGYDRNCPR